MKEIPQELKKAIGGLDDDTRLHIFLTLKRDKELSFSDLSERVNMKNEKAKMLFHLKKLTESALVEHKYKHQIGNEKYSFYAITKFGENLWNNIVASLRPPFPIQSMSDTSNTFQNEIITEIPIAFALQSSTESVSMSLVQSTRNKKMAVPEQRSDRVNYNVASVKETD
jgi:hypothetical protein